MQDVRVSFDLAVLAMDGPADAAAAQAMLDRCETRPHVEGDVDERIAGFYERLVALFPDKGPIDDETSPWMSMPLGIGIDHVIMNLSYSSRSDPAIDAIEQLAAEYRLVLWDPQGGEVHPPPRETKPPRWRLLRR